MPNFFAQVKPSPSTRVRFGAFVLDLTSGELRSLEGGNIQVLLREQAFQVLRMLVEHRGKIVTREEIKKKLWPNDTIVDFDQSINATIKTLRRALGDSADDPQYIETLARRGYRLRAPIEWLESTAGLPGGEGFSAQVLPDPGGLIGKKVSHYRVLEAIGAGGMGMVYKAQDLKLGRRVALKFLPEELARDPVALKRFEREAQTASALNHSNICTIYEIEEHQGQPFIVMELLEGGTLRHRIAASETKPLPLAEVFAIAKQICDGLQAAHERGIVHRDVKPANIFLTRQGPVKILDFGLAKLAASKAGGEKDETEASSETPLPSSSSDQSVPHTEQLEITLTSTGTAAGTAAYMSPEQVRKEELDGRSDLFSFGMILYEMTTGRCAFTGATVDEVHHAILYQTPVPVRDVNSAAPRALDSAIGKALEKDRAKRYQSAAELREDLAQAGKQKHWRKAVLTGASAVILLVAGYLSWRNFRPGTPPGPEKTMLAVLPFENLTGDPNKEYLADGLTEETISQLAGLNPQQLGVIARTSVMGYKHKDVRLDQVGRELSVQYVLESSLRQSGDHIRLTAQLVQVKDQTHLWSQDYDYAAKDTLSVEDEVARAVAREIRVRLTSQQQEDLARSRPVNPEAFDAYLQGYHFFEGSTGKDADMAAKYFERATQLDPSYALAWAYLSRARNWQANDGLIPMEEGKRLAREAVERALALDPNLAVAHAQMGRIKQQVDYDWAGANASFQRAVALEPGNPEHIGMAALTAACFGRFDEALQWGRRAIDLDPLNAHSWESLAETEAMMGQLDQAAADSKKALEVNPDYWGSSIELSRIYLLQGRPQDALREMERVKSDAYRAPLSALTYYALGRKKESDAALQELIMKYHASEAFEIAMAYAFRNQTDEAFEWLDRAYAQHDPSLGCTKGQALLNSLHNDPRYAAFLKKLKLPN